MCRASVDFPPPKAFNLIDLKEGDNWPSHTGPRKWTWKCDPRLTEMDVLWSFQEAYTLFLLKSATNLLSGNCQVRCWLFQLPHLHPCSTQHACLWLMCLLSMLHLCHDALVRQKLRLLSLGRWSSLSSSSAHPFPLGLLRILAWSCVVPRSTFHLQKRLIL